MHVASFAPIGHTSLVDEKQEKVKMVEYFKKNREGLKKKTLHLWLPNDVLEIIVERAQELNITQGAVINDWLKKAAQKYINRRHWRR